MHTLLKSSCDRRLDERRHWWRLVWATGGLFFAAVTPTLGQALKPQSLSAASYVERGHDWYEKGELDRAMADFNIALTFDAQCANAYLFRGL